MQSGPADPVRFCCLPDPTITPDPVPGSIDILKKRNFSHQNRDKQKPLIEQRIVKTNTTRKRSLTLRDYEKILEKEMSAYETEGDRGKYLSLI